MTNYALLTGFQRDILWIINEEGPVYGLAVKRELEDYLGEQVTHGRLYQNLDQLVDAGLVEKSERDKRTNEYELTQAGRTAIDRREDWQEVRR
jgi:DNA-binding PadR family transcriptional regulator